MDEWELKAMARAHMGHDEFYADCVYCESEEKDKEPEVLNIDESWGFEGQWQGPIKPNK